MSGVGAIIACGRTRFRHAGRYRGQRDRLLSPALPPFARARTGRADRLDAPGPALPANAGSAAAPNLVEIDEQDFVNQSPLIVYRLGSLSAPGSEMATSFP